MLILWLTIATRYGTVYKDSPVTMLSHRTPDSAFRWRVANTVIFSPVFIFPVFLQRVNIAVTSLTICPQVTSLTYIQLYRGWLTIKTQWFYIKMLHVWVLSKETFLFTPETNLHLDYLFLSPIRWSKRWGFLLVPHLVLLSDLTVSQKGWRKGKILWTRSFKSRASEGPD